MSGARRLTIVGGCRAALFNPMIEPLRSAADRAASGGEGQEKLGVHNVGCDSMQELIHKLRAYEQEHNDLVLEITAHMLLAVRASAQDRLQVPILCQECAEICLAVSSLAAAEALCMLCQCLHAVIKTHSRI